MIANCLRLDLFDLDFFTVSSILVLWTEPPWGRPFGPNYAYLLFVITWTKKSENGHLNNHISSSVVLSISITKILYWNMAWEVIFATTGYRKKPVKFKFQTKNGSSTGFHRLADRFDRFTGPVWVVTSQIQILNKKRQFNRFPPVSRPVWPVYRSGLTDYRSVWVVTGQIQFFYLNSNARKVY